MCEHKFRDNIRECAPFAKFAKIIDREHFATYGIAATVMFSLHSVCLLQMAANSSSKQLRFVRLCHLLVWWCNINSSALVNGAWAADMALSGLCVKDRLAQGHYGPFHMDTVNRFGAFTGVTYPVLKPICIPLMRLQTRDKNPLRSYI